MCGSRSLLARPVQRALRYPFKASPTLLQWTALQGKMRRQQAGGPLRMPFSCSFLEFPKITGGLVNIWSFTATTYHIVDNARRQCSPAALLGGMEYPGHRPPSSSPSSQSGISQNTYPPPRGRNFPRCRARGHLPLPLLLFGNGTPWFSAHRGWYFTWSGNDAVLTLPWYDFSSISFHFVIMIKNSN